jgi:hypothetical protein
MFFTIIATGNHFIMDAAGGAAVITLAYGLVLLFEKLKEKHYFRLALHRD